MAGAPIGQSLGGAGGGFSNFATGLETLFGSSTDISGTGATKGTTKGTQTEQLNVDQQAITKIINDILGGPQGLASIFSDQNVSGLYGSTVSKQAAGDLVSKLAGEIAKLTAKKTTTTDQATNQSTTQNQTQDKGGALSGIGSTIESAGHSIANFGSKVFGW